VALRDIIPHVIGPREETVETKYIAQAYDDYRGEKGAFEKDFQALKREVDPDVLTRVVQPFNEAVAEIELDPCALKSGPAFEQFYTRASRTFHEHFHQHRGPEMPADMARHRAERAFMSVFPGGAGEAFDTAHRKGLRYIVRVLCDHLKSTTLNGYFEKMVTKRMDVPEPVMRHIIRLLKEWVEFKRGRA